MSWDDLGVELNAWPKVSEVKAYRRHVRELVLSLIDTLPLNGPIDWQSPWWAIIMGVEHERIHLETSSVLIRQHQLHHVQPQHNWPYCTASGPAPGNELIAVPAGLVTLGKNPMGIITAGITNTASTAPKCPHLKPRVFSKQWRI